MEKQSFVSDLKFSGKTVVVTGSGTGIGQAIAKKFAKQGANIVIMGRRKEPLDQTSELLRGIISSVKSPGKVATFPGVDVADEAGINLMFQGIRDQFGKVDIIVNNAGVSGPVQVFTNATVSEFRDAVAIHLTGTFWTSVSGLKAMERGGKIITIATFFTEENRYEQRPYRFRTPYTAAQGAKNRLAEALAWELVERGIRSIATNPGPVHSDRIYKTVYPKAAAEFLRIGGFPGLSSPEIEKVTHGALPALGEGEPVLSRAIHQVAGELSRGRAPDAQEGDVTKLSETISGALAKIQEIAEKIQSNTSKMIVDGEFLTQEEVAEMVMNLCDEKISKLVNGRVIPNDRVFYPVKPVVGTSVGGPAKPDLGGLVVILSVGSLAKVDIDRVRNVAVLALSSGAKQVVVITKEHADHTRFGEFQSHSADLLDENALRGIFGAVKAKCGRIDSVIHFTGDYDYNSPLSTLTRKQWDTLVEDFIYIPALITKEAVNAMAPAGAVQEPASYKGSTGVVVLVGPNAPIGKKIPGLVRARSEVFRGALRPYTATVNQELEDVLGSNIRLYLILPGSTDGIEPNSEILQRSVLNLATGSAFGRNEAIFYIDEARKSE